MTPDDAYSKVVIDVCSDDSCTDATPFSESPFKSSNTPHQLYDLGTLPLALCVSVFHLSGQDTRRPALFCITTLI